MELILKQRIDERIAPPSFVTIPPRRDRRNDDAMEDNAGTDRKLILYIELEIAGFKI